MLGQHLGLGEAQEDRVLLCSVHTSVPFRLLLGRDPGNLCDETLSMGDLGAIHVHDVSLIPEGASGIR